jgi:hypothetical protein
MSISATAETLRDLERRRLRCLVEGGIAEATLIHAPDFQLVHPGGGVWTKEQYLGGIADGTINYRRFEAVSEIEVIIGGDSVRDRQLGPL